MLRISNWWYLINREFHPLIYIYTHKVLLAYSFINCDLSILTGTLCTCKKITVKEKSKIKCVASTFIFVECDVDECYF